MIKRLSGFKGEMPKVHPRLLPDNYAQNAENTRLENGALVPLRKPGLERQFNIISDSFVPKTVFLHNGVWRLWPIIKDVVPAPVAEDRLYLTSGSSIGGGPPELFVDPNTYPLAVAAPASTLTLVANGTVDPDIKEGVVYTYTYVTSFDEESQPAALSAEVEFSPGMNVDLSGFVVSPSSRVDRIRVYRSQTSALGVTELYFVKELPVATTTFNHDPNVDPLQEPIPSKDFTPPVDGLSGIISLPNGIMAAFFGKELFFSEPYMPHAWPVKYALKTDYKIVGLGAFGSNIAVMTEGSPYVVQGVHPSTMIMELLEVNLPCTAALGIVDLGYSIAYPSTEGLVTIGQSGAKLVTNGLFTREQWAALNSETFIASQHRGRYIVSHLPDGAATREMMIIDLTGDQPFLMRANYPAESMFFETGTGRMFFVYGGAVFPPAGDILEWDKLSQPLEDQNWKTKLFNLPTPTNYGALLIEGDVIEGPGTLVADVYADGVKKGTITKWNEPMRLPSGFMAVRWEIDVTTNISVSSISIANDISEFGEGG